ncbi:MAG: oligosaccharide flippase family protein [Planctomycetes bacterium]|nr:oligosaccharide flippase family protein [Planctomycetota bacterium]
MIVSLARSLPGVAAWRPALALIDQGVVSGSRFAATIVIGRLCGPEELGAYSLAFAAIILAGCAQEALITTPYAVFGNRLRSRSRATYAAASLLLYGGLAAMTLIGLLLGAAGCAGAGVSGRTIAVLLTLAVTVPAFLLWELARRFAFAQLDMARALAIDAAVVTLNLLGLAALAAAGWLTAPSALATLAGSSLLVAGVWLIAFRRGATIDRAHAFLYWRRNWRFGRWVLGGQLLGAAHGTAPQLLLGLLAGAAATGTFTALQTIALMTNPIFMGLANLLTPAAAKTLADDGRPELWRLLRRAMAAMASVMAIFAIVLTVWGQSLVEFIYGRQYAGSGIPIALLGLCPIAWAINVALACGLTALQRPEVNFRASAVGILVTSLVIPLLLSQDPALAGAVGLLAGSIATVVVQAAASRLCSRAISPACTAAPSATTSSGLSRL